MSLPTFRIPEHYPKGWGEEIYLANNDQYCGKLLCFKSGAKFSAHFHALKAESFYVMRGKILFSYIHPITAKRVTNALETGSVVDIPRFCVHQVEALEESVIIEVSTHHEDSDSYRVAPGDSQKA